MMQDAVVSSFRGGDRNTSCSSLESELSALVQCTSSTLLQMNNSRFFGCYVVASRKYGWQKVIILKIRGSATVRHLRLAGNVIHVWQTVYLRLKTFLTLKSKWYTDRYSPRTRASHTTHI